MEPQFLIWKSLVHYALAIYPFTYLIIVYLKIKDNIVLVLKLS